MYTWDEYVPKKTYIDNKNAFQRRYRFYCRCWWRYIVCYVLIVWVDRVEVHLPSKHGIEDSRGSHAHFHRQLRSLNTCRDSRITSTFPGTPRILLTWVVNATLYSTDWCIFYVGYLKNMSLDDVRLGLQWISAVLYEFSGQMWPTYVKVNRLWRPYLNLYSNLKLASFICRPIYW